MPRSGLAVIFLLASALSGHGAVVSFLNASSGDLTFTVGHKGTPDILVKLPTGRTTAVRVGRVPTLRMTLNGKSVAYKLDPYTPYLFVEDDKGAVSFSGVELAGALPNSDDVPADPPVWKPLKLPVTLFTDSSSPLVKEVREKSVTARFAAAAKVIEDQVGVTFQAREVREWDVDMTSNTLSAALEQFQERAEVKGGRAFGFITRALKGDELAVPPKVTHALVKDGSPKAEPERVEIVTHQLGQWLGAVRSADGGSVMRAKLGDGQAVKKGWVVQFDPHNLIVMHIWAAELAAGRVKPEEFSAKARLRLHVLYRSIAAVHVAVKSGDAQARDLSEVFAGGPPVERVLDEAKPAIPLDPRLEPDLSEDDKAVRLVVRAITARAKELAADEKSRPKGDQLTAEYVKAAAAAAVDVDEKRRSRAFLLGLGIGLDDSTILREKPVVKKLCVAVEPEVDFRSRLEVLGRPTIRGRRDLCQHFAVSAALTEMFGSVAAEFAGLSKELSDMKGTSGFSFADLAADLAGIELASAVTQDPNRVAEIARQFVTEDYVPDIAPFPEGLTETAFKKKYSATDDAKFKAAMDDVREAVKAVAAYRRR